MKTKIKSIVSVFTMLVTFLLSGKCLSQACNITLDNSSNCNLTVTVDWYDNSVPGCTTICDTQPGLSVPSTSSTPAACSGCAGVCNFRVTVTAPPVFAGMTVNGNSQSAGPVSGTCGSTTQLSLQWGTNNCDFSQ